MEIETILQSLLLALIASAAGIISSWWQHKKDMRSIEIKKEEVASQRMLETRDLESKVAEKYQEIAYKSAQRVDELRTKVDELECKLSVVEDQLKERDKVIAERDKVIAERDKSIADRDKIIKTMDKAIKERDKIIRNWCEGIEILIEQISNSDQEPKWKPE